MSGGYFRSNYYNLYDLAEELRRVIANNDSTEVNEHGDKIGTHFSFEVLQEIKAAEVFCYMARIYLHRVDYLLSGDDGEKSFLDRLQEDLNEFEAMMKTRMERNDYSR